MSESKFIESLRERIRQEPGSRLFLTLAEELIKRDMYEEAAETLERGLAVSPDFAGAHLTLAKLYASRREFGKALFEYEEAKRIFPSSLTALRGIAAVYRDSGEADAAAEAYREVLLIDPLDQFASEFIDSYIPKKAPACIDEPELVESDDFDTAEKPVYEVIDQSEQYREDRKTETISRLNNLLEGIKKTFAFPEGGRSAVSNSRGA
ncbi:MAG: hypothetical protein LLF86_07185 [Nitrospiraceae bacterium]|nr:hypothetical protein [Nitrospiraceae bacterium]